ncbi:MFS transporter [Roseateles sp. NT4]|uniref:MFS transporter n=1 Tax=Roseateles sp. NT4 TaxID=3453715 RepID=UPI003EEA9250
MRHLIPADVRVVLTSNRGLRAVLLADFLVLLNELGSAVILPWWLASRGGAQAIATFSVALAVAAFFIVPAVSPLGDRICKARQITSGLGCLCGVAVAMVALSFSGVFNVPALAMLAIVQVLAASFVDPARDAVLPEVTTPASLPLALRLRKTTHAVAGIVGPLLAGAALGVAGVTATLCGSIAMLAVAMLVASRIPKAVTVKPRSGGFDAWWSELRAGLAAKWRVPMERGWTLVNFAVWIFQGPVVGMLIPIKVHALGLQGQWLGLCLGALSLGVLLGSVFGSQMLVNRFGRYRVRVGLGFSEGIALAAVGLSMSPWLMLTGLLVAGFCNAAMSLVGATHRALAIPQEYRVRMFAAGSMTTRLAGAIGPALVGTALASHSVTWVYTAWSLLMAVCVLGFLAVPRLKEFLTLEHGEIEDWYRRQYPTVFR